MIDSENSLGKMIVLTAPSGSGKTTLVKHLLQKFDFLDFSISATTRDQRSHEVDGKDYYFLSPEEFKTRLANDEFIEHEEVYENQFYGTLKSEVDRIWSLGKVIIFDIDVKGAKNIKDLYGEQCLTIFVRPPSVEVLISRLTARATENEESLRKRIARIREEITYEPIFDTVVVNDLLEVAQLEAEYLVKNFVGRLYN
ncbi:MAG TPA: guanylate kinase [Saprospiraceae bacterium]|nr:guanylate kinase [Saprospiraceae bacterium]